jgi:hypothetical protein
MKTLPLRTPWLVQRCTVAEGKINYDYMGSTEFEVGDQAKALKKIFAAGIKEGELKIIAPNGREMTIFMVAGEDFDFDAYQPHLQALASGKLRLQERASFDDVVITKSTGVKRPGYNDRINAWFDFTSRYDGENAVLWTLSRDDQKRLTAALRDIKNKWSKK